MILSYWDVPDLKPKGRPNMLPTSIMRVPPDAIPPANTQLWRFMDFPKLLSLLENRALFFTRADKLDDPYEGIWSKATIQLLDGTIEREVTESDEHIVLRNTVTNQSLKLVRPFSTEFDPKAMQIFENMFANGDTSGVQVSTSKNNLIIRHVPTGQRFIIFDFQDSVREKGKAVAYPLLDSTSAISASQQIVGSARTRSRFTLVNCWHESEHESEAMWRLYSGNNYGIAIRTTVNALIDSFVRHYPSAIARIQYIPYNQGVMPMDADTPFLFKRINFQQEREVRAIMTQYVEYQDIQGDRNVVQIDYSREVCEVGLNYEIEPEKLIHEIVISPYAAAWLLDLTKSVTSKYGLNIPVLRSELNESP